MKNLCAVVLLVILAVPSLSSAQNTDIELLRTFNLERNTRLDQAFLVTTHSFGIVAIAVPATLTTIGIIKKDSLSKQNALMITGSLVGSSVVMLGMKWGFGRDRPFVTYPELENLVHPKDNSFPSGHTSVAFSTATSLSIAYQKWYVYVPSFLWAGAVGYSRMHLGVHYPSDVLIGALIGSGSAFLSSYLTEKIQLKRRSKKLQL
ncbi:MAG: phosphatase PAP2 family protein [Crocinitomicaceae bacterium]